MAVEVAEPEGLKLVGWMLVRLSGQGMPSEWKSAESLSQG